MSFMIAQLLTAAVSNLMLHDGVREVYKVENSLFLRLINITCRICGRIPHHQSLNLATVDVVEKAQGLVSLWVAPWALNRPI